MAKKNEIATQSQSDTGIISVELQHELTEMVQRRNALVALNQQVMVKDQDYGVIPGVGKPSLFKPGAEKLISFFNLSVEIECTDKAFDVANRHIMYTYKASIKDKTGRIISQCEGSVNSFEAKWRYIWVKENNIPKGVDKSTLVTRGSAAFEFGFAVDKAETTGKYGKSAEYWAKFKAAIENGTAKKVVKETKNGKSEGWEIADYDYRVENPDILGMQNTIQKMAEKRAIVGAVLLATGASEFYTQDVEDMEFLDVSATVIDSKVHVAEEVKQEALTPEIVKPEPKFEHKEKEKEAIQNATQVVDEPTTDEKVASMLKTNKEKERVDATLPPSVPLEWTSAIRACNDLDEMNELLHDPEFQVHFGVNHIKQLYLDKLVDFCDTKKADYTRVREFCEANKCYGMIQDKLTKKFLEKKPK